MNFLLFSDWSQVPYWKMNPTTSAIEPMTWSALRTLQRMLLEQLDRTQIRNVVT